MMKKNEKKGILLIIVSLVLLAVKMLLPQMGFDVKLDYVISGAILLTGLIFEISFFASVRKRPSFLMVGGIMCVIGIHSIVGTFFDWHFYMQTWPVYILAVIVGFLQMYLFWKKKRAYRNVMLILLSVFVWCILIAVSTARNDYLDTVYLVIGTTFTLGCVLMMCRPKKQVNWNYVDKGMKICKEKGAK